MSTTRFTSHQRGGLAVGASAGQARLALDITAAGASEPTQSVEVPVGLAGAGDVAGLHPSAVVRRTPAPGSDDLRPGQLAAAEIADPALPWSLTPDTAGATGRGGDRLLPWIALLVLPEGDGLSLSPAAGSTLARLRGAASGHLWDPADAWAWAHVEGSGASARARLLCPVRLTPGTAYVAALVPVFETGRLTGIGTPLAEDAQPSRLHAWDPAADSVDLPVYDHWRFTTGRGRSVEEMLRDLHPVRLGAASPTLPLTDPTGLVPRLGDTTSPRTVLRPGVSGAERLSADLAALSPRDLREVAKELRLDTEGLGAAQLRTAVRRRLVDAGLDPLTTSLATIRPRLRRYARPAGAASDLLAACAETTRSGEPRLPLPAWGRPHAGGEDPPATTRSQVDKARRWYRSLNSDPGLRLAAGLGQELVRARQDELVAFCWAAAGGVREANALLGRAQAAIAAATPLHERVAALPDADALGVLAPAFARTPGHDPTLGATAAGALRGTTVEAAGDRWVRGGVRRGSLARSTRHLAEDDPITAVASVGSTLAGGVVPAGTPTADVDNLPTPSTERPARGTAADPRRALQALLDLGQTDPTSVLEGDDSEVPRLLTATAGDRITDQQRPDAQPAPTHDSKLVADAAAHVRKAVAPAAVVAARVAARIPGLAALVGEDKPPAPVLVDPVWPEPVLEALAAYDADRIVPGLTGMPIDGIALLELDAPAMEAVVVGAGTELAAELVWRGFPGDLRISPVRRAFPGLEETGGGSGGSGGSGDAYDLPPLSTWGSALGEHLADAPGVWLVMRTPVLRVAPGTLVYLAPARWSRAGDRVLDPTRDPLVPLAFGDLGPDTMYAGFDLPDVASARGPARGSENDAAGWFVVFEQPSGERTFGPGTELTPDPGGAGGSSSDPLDSWNGLLWRDLPGAPADPRRPDPTAPQMLTPTGDPTRTPSGGGQPRWGRSSADLAAILVERPVSVAIHASDLLDVEGAPTVGAGGGER